MPNWFFDNFTAPIPFEFNMLSLKNSIDNGIIDYLYLEKRKKENLGLDFDDHSAEFSDGYTKYISSTWSHVPLTASRFFKDANIISLVGSFYFALGPLVTFVIILTEVVKEKELKLRQGLNVVGLSHGPFWLHWLITGMFFSAITSLTTILAGLACQFDLFFNADFFILFILFFMFSIAMLMLAFILSTCVSTQRVAYTISYAFVLLAIVILLMFTNSLVLYFIFFNDRSESYVGVLRAIFYMFPPFIYTLIFGVIVRKATTHFDDNSQQFLKGTSFTWSDLVKPEIGEYSTGDTYKSPTPLHSFGMLLLVITVYAILVWYFDHVISSNRGTNERFYFFLTPKYWETVFCKKRALNRIKEAKKNENLDELLANSEFHGKVDKSVEEEKEKVIDDVRSRIR